MKVLAIVFIFANEILSAQTVSPFKVDPFYFEYCGHNYSTDLFDMNFELNEKYFEQFKTDSVVISGIQGYMLKSYKQYTLVFTNEKLRRLYAFDSADMKRRLQAIYFYKNERVSKIGFDFPTGLVGRPDTLFFTYGSQNELIDCDSKGRNGKNSFTYKNNKLSLVKKSYNGNIYNWVYEANGIDVREIRTNYRDRIDTMNFYKFDKDKRLINIDRKITNERLALSYNKAGLLSEMNYIGYNNTNTVSILTYDKSNRLTGIRQTNLSDQDVGERIFFIIEYFKSGKKL